MYHITWRGVCGQEIFHDDQDRRKFLTTVLKYKQEMDLGVHGWCLMNNHIHLLLKEGREDISSTMKRIGICYVQFYHWKYRTGGPLFQDRFSSENVDSIRYLGTVIRYIHQNPVKAGMVKKCDDWKWSSCLGYYGQWVFPEGLLEDEFILKLLDVDIDEARKKFKEFNESYNEDECLEPSSGIKRLTDEEARAEIKKLLGGEVEIPQVKSLPSDRRKALLRTIKGIRGLSQRQAARILGISPSLVFKA